jgi:Putative peptidoglycan binding domain/LysM domain
MTQHTVKQGECLNSIAYDNGFFWQTLWDADENSDLKDLRQDARVLMPGDTVTIIDKRQKTQEGPTDQRHRFKMKGVPAKLRIQLMWNGQPRANQDYQIEIDGQKATGTTDGEGKLEFSIPPNAKSGTLTIGQELQQRTYNLKLGSLNPVKEITGLQQRLNNLGYWCGPVTGEMNDGTRAAVKDFQTDAQIDIDGIAGSQTDAKLTDFHEIDGGPIQTPDNGSSGDAGSSN